MPRTALIACIGLQPEQDFFHLDVERRIHRITLLRPIEGDPGDSFLIGLDENAGIFFRLSHLDF
jgi:hypothetical protein